MKVRMTEQIQNIIIATQAYKKFIVADSRVKNYKIEDIYLKVYDYYKSILPADGELRPTYFCYDAVLAYPIEQTTSTETEDLGKFTFGY